MKSLVVVIGVMLASLVARVAVATEEKRFMDGEFWREQALTDIIPYWLKYARDGEYGAFHRALYRKWQLSSPWNRFTTVISLQYS